MSHHFENVSLLITHYNRSESLKRLLESLKSLSLSFGEIVVSDDCSSDQHLAYLQSLEKSGQIKLAATPVNKGLGNNLNKGQNATTKPYVLYIQEDFIPRPLFVEKFKFSLNMMEQDSTLDMARYYSYFDYPFRDSIGEGFSKMKFSFFLPGYRKFAFYSDHPHLRRSNFFDRFGQYREGIKPDKTEFSMMMSVIQQKGQGIFYDDFKELFDQMNDIEPSSLDRSSWMEKRRHSPNIFLIIARQLYRYTVFNFKYLFINYKNGK